MSDITDYFAEELTNHAFGKITMSSYTELFVGLSTAAILADGTGSAEPGFNYVRKPTLTSVWTLDAGWIDNDVDIKWDPATGSWGEIRWAFLADTEPAGTGNILIAKAISPFKTVAINDRVEFLAGNLRFRLDRIV